MSVDKMPPSAPDSGHALPDLSALDAALREVIAAARIEPTPSTAPMDVPEGDAGEIAATIDAVTRAASTIDQLVERNRALTQAAVRSVEFFRAEAAQARSQADQMRAEMEALREETEALKAAALAHAEELEAELSARTEELDAARSWIADIRGHVETLLGNVEQRLTDTKAEPLFDER